MLNTEDSHLPLRSQQSWEMLTVWYFGVNTKIRIQGIKMDSDGKYCSTLLRFEQGSLQWTYPFAQQDQGCEKRFLTCHHQPHDITFIFWCHEVAYIGTPILTYTVTLNRGDGVHGLILSFCHGCWHQRMWTSFFMEMVFWGLWDHRRGIPGPLSLPHGLVPPWVWV